MSDSLLKPVSLKYRSRQNVYGNYKMKWIYPTQYQTSYALTGAGQIQNTYQIQSNVFNNSLSRVNFRITVPAQGAGTYINHYIRGQKAITNISYAPQGGVDLAPFANIDRLCDITARPEISYKELCAKDVTQSFATAATMSSKFEGLTKCDAPGSNVCYLDGSEIQRTNENSANVLTAPTNTIMIIDYSLPGDIFKNTIWIHLNML